MSTTAATPVTAGLPSPARASASPLRIVLKALASLQLTVGLFAFAVGLVFFGTLAQKSVGMWTVVDQYFWSWIVMVDFQHLVEFGKVFFGIAPDFKVGSWAQFPFPGGKLLGGLMFVESARCAHPAIQAHLEAVRDLHPPRWRSAAVCRRVHYPRVSG